jgi:hypothetical protein
VGHPAEVKIKVKGSRQECPLHTGNVATFEDYPFVDYPNVPLTCHSGVGSKKSAAFMGRVFYWG